MGGALSVSMEIPSFSRLRRGSVRGFQLLHSGERACLASRENGRLDLRFDLTGATEFQP
jgi:hypothetical protein